MKKLLILFLLTFSSHLFALTGLIPAAYYPSYVRLFPDINYEGHTQIHYPFFGKVERGTNILDLRNKKFINGAYDNYNDIISSIQVSKGCSVTLYEDINYQGRSEIFTESDPDLRDNFIANDSVSSLKVSCEPLFLHISPPTGHYVTSQTTDIVIIMTKPVFTSNIFGEARMQNYDFHKATFDGAPITEFFNDCIQMGTLSDKEGKSFRCPAIPMKNIQAGEHVLTVEVKVGCCHFESKTVKWTVLDNKELP
ncbi:MAG: hypothetical protein KAH08_08705 [Methylococcales bacterium]|nr:hypothetical protein [Methylococcales bacterium]